jgi:DNA recombination protein RmuC
MVLTFTGIAAATILSLAVGYALGKITEKNKTLKSELNLKENYDAILKEIERRAFIAEERLKQFDDAKKAMSNEFENLAHKIFKQKSEEFSEASKKDLGNLLEPVKTQLTEFRDKVEKFYIGEETGRKSLKDTIDSLMKQNNELSQNSQNLTNALKGNSKTQGSWGEFILLRVLEDSGLIKGTHYDVQQSLTNDEGSRLQPDVTIRLPEGRYLIVDSKVSLTAYHDLANAESDSDRKQFLNSHLASIRNHIRGLSSKNYQLLHGVNSIDFVLMFMPVEPAFMTAVSHEKGLFMEAWEKNVMLVSPSTLLFVLRTVAHLWRQEDRSNNVQEIAKRGAMLYDKFVGFCEDIEDIGLRLQKAQESYQSATSKLTGSGGLIGQAKKLEDLGIKPNKILPKKFSSASKDDRSDGFALDSEQNAE